MKTHYRIDGMHCGGCVNKVTRALTGMPDITTATVSLPNAAVVESATVIPAAVLEERLKTIGSYTVREGSTSVLEKLRPFAPLGIMFAIVLVWASIASYPWGHHVYHDWMRHFMGGFFLLFGVLKVINLQNFAAMYKGYDLLAARVAAWGYVYPFVEMLLGVLYTFDAFALQANVATAILMTFGSIGIARKLMRGGTQTCACLGGFFSVPLTWITVAENMLMALMAVFMLFYH